jgi:hypothetical protein
MPGFQINNIISFSKNLSKDFVNHIDSTSNLCVYKLGSHYIPKHIFFPKVDNVTLINCSRDGILNILTPNIFPNLSKINYLSADPGNYEIYERFNNNIKWVFPNKSYDFYDFMVKTGRGRKDSQLIKKYVANKKIIDGKNGFDISFHFDLNVPGFGIADGEWWSSQFYEYLLQKQYLYLYKDCMYPGEKVILQDDEEILLQKEYVKSSIDKLYFDHITDSDLDTELK